MRPHGNSIGRAGIGLRKSSHDWVLPEILQSLQLWTGAFFLSGLAAGALISYGRDKRSSLEMNDGLGEPEDSRVPATEP
jgi:hypothetical protein